LLAAPRARNAVFALVASGAADGLLPVALTFAVLRVTGSAGRLGVVLAVQSTLALLLTLAGGVAADRFGPGRILTASLAMRTIVAALLATALVTANASFAMLLALAAVYGCADGLFVPASVALLPEVVARDQLAAANAVVGGTTSVLRIAAPAVAGLVVAALGPGAAFASQAAVLAAAVALLAWARLPCVSRPSRAFASPLTQAREGWTVFTRHRWLWLLTGQWSVFSLVVLAPVAVLGPAIALRALGGPAAWGFITSCLSVGAVFGQVLAGRIGARARPALVIAWLVPVMTGEAIALGLGAPLPVVCLAAVASGIAYGLQAVIFPTAMQSAVPSAVLSRVVAIDLLGSEAGQPVGYALAGPIGQAVGAHSVLASAGIGMFAASALFAFLPALRVRDSRDTG
jgi:Transmembrane secretion effector